MLSKNRPLSVVVLLSAFFAKVKQGLRAGLELGLGAISLLCFSFGFLFVANTSLALSVDGHVKAQAVYSAFDQDSAFVQSLGETNLDALMNSRVNLRHSVNTFSFAADYELATYASPKLGVSEAGAVDMNLLPSDKQRFFNFTQTVYEEGDYAIVQRLDRAALTYSGDKVVAKIGRQALSWGNGLMFSAMDLVNPFDPIAIDKEYKAGDDMLYAQILNDGGSDWQFAWVLRRDEQGEHHSDVDSFAAKYHGFSELGEYDLLFMQHYGDTVIGAGAAINVGGSVLRTDLVNQHSDGANYLNAVASLSYSWTSMNKPMSAMLEYYHNDYGLAERPYSAQAIAANPELAKRLARGELYNLGRDYIGASWLLELHPLWNFSPNAFVNLNDSSALLQLLNLWDLSQNTRLTLSLNKGLGERGTEFTGPEYLPGQYYSQSWSFYGEFGWYF